MFDYYHINDCGDYVQCFWVLEQDFGSGLHYVQRKLRGKAIAHRSEGLLFKFHARSVQTLN